MSDVKRARKQIDVFIRRMIKLYNACNVLKEHLSNSNAFGKFDENILTNTNKQLIRAKRAVTRYLGLDKSIEELYKYIRYLEDRLRGTPTFLYTEKDKVGYSATEDTLDHIRDVMAYSSDCIFGICHLVPVVGHKYLVEDEGVVSFTAPVNKTRIFGRKE